MSPVPGVVAFLGRALDDAEGDALEVVAGGGYETWNNICTGVVEVHGREIDGLVSLGRETAIFVAENDPAHVLKVVAVRRSILDEYEQARSFYAKNTADAGEVSGLLFAVRVLATAYGWTP